MPRVSDEHLAARRQQILDAARACFLRKGFHNTSMQDVIAEAGLSVGAVYRYFKSKHDIVSAIAERTIGGINEAFAAIAGHEPAYGLVEAMDRVLDVVDAQTGPDGMFAMALQVWAEAVREPDIARFVAEKYPPLRANFVRIAERARERGELSTDADVAAVGAVLFGIVPGFALQRILTGTPDKETFLVGVRALLDRGPR